MIFKNINGASVLFANVGSGGGGGGASGSAGARVSGSTLILDGQGDIVASSDTSLVTVASGVMRPTVSSLYLLAFGGVSQLNIQAVSTANISVGGASGRTNDALFTFHTSSPYVLPSEGINGLFNAGNIMISKSGLVIPAIAKVSTAGIDVYFPNMDGSSYTIASGATIDIALMYLNRYTEAQAQILTQQGA